MQSWSVNFSRAQLVGPSQQSCLYDAYNVSMNITLAELEEAINYWRTARPSTGEERALSPEVNVLANVYAMMIFNRLTGIDANTVEPACLQLIDAWRKQTA
jgi:hypothetical protein